MSNIEEIIAKRLVLVNNIRQLFNEIATSIDTNYFLRGPVQMAILTKLDLPKTGMNKKLINEVVFSQGYRKTSIHGFNYYSRVS